MHTHVITTATGTRVPVPTIAVTGDANGQASFLREAWLDAPGHVEGRYTNFQEQAVQDMALAWRLRPGATVKQAYVAMRALDGGTLCRAADKAARRLGYTNHVEARRAAGVK